MSPRVRVAIVMGGRSSEHEISVASARSVLDSLDPDRYDAVTVEIDREGKWQLESGESRALDRGAAGEPDEGEGRTAVETLPVPTESVPATLAEVDVVIPILHGPFGEDGTVQGLLTRDVPLGRRARLRSRWTRTGSRQSCATPDPVTATSRGRG
jgi:D-alanine-D-alanine ligase